MQVNVVQLLKAPIGTTRSYQVDETVDIASSESIVQGEIKLVYTGRGILVEGTLQTTIEVTCSRCLSLFNYPLTLNIEGELSGYTSNTSSPRSLSQWRDGGGIINVTSLNITWPPINAEAEGTLTLDKNMYLLGSFSSKITGYQEALEDMAKLGWIKKKKALIPLIFIYSICLL